MLAQELEDFLQKAMTDPELKRKFIEFAADKGFQVSLDELDDSDLDKVVGGASSIKIRAKEREGETTVEAL